MDNCDYFSLNRLPLGESAVVSSLLSSGSERRRIMDLGLVQGTKISAVHRSPSGDPVAYFFRGTVIALREADARKIIIKH